MCVTLLRTTCDCPPKIWWLGAGLLASASALVVWRMHLASARVALEVAALRREVADLVLTSRDNQRAMDMSVKQTASDLSVAISDVQRESKNGIQEVDWEMSMQATELQSERRRLDEVVSTVQSLRDDLDHVSRVSQSSHLTLSRLDGSLEEVQARQVSQERMHQARHRDCVEIQQRLCGLHVSIQHSARDRLLLVCALDERQCMTAAFGVWGRASLSARLSRREILLPVFIGWTRVVVVARAGQEESRLEVIDDRLEELEARAFCQDDPVDSDTEFHERCVGIAEEVERQEMIMSSTRCGGCRHLQSRMGALEAVAKRLLVYRGSPPLLARACTLFVLFDAWVSVVPALDSPACSDGAPSELSTQLVEGEQSSSSSTAAVIAEPQGPSSSFHASTAPAGSASGSESVARRSGDAMCDVVDTSGRPLSE